MLLITFTALAACLC